MSLGDPWGRLADLGKSKFLFNFVGCPIAAAAVRGIVTLAGVLPDAGVTIMVSFSQPNCWHSTLLVAAHPSGVTTSASGLAFGLIGCLLVGIALAPQTESKSSSLAPLFFKKRLRVVLRGCVLSGCFRNLFQFAQLNSVPGRVLTSILAEGAIALSVTLSGGVLFAS